MITGTLQYVTTISRHVTQDIFKNRNWNAGLVLNKTVSRKRGAMLTDSLRTKISQSRSSVHQPWLLMSEDAGLTWGKGKTLTPPRRHFPLTSPRLGRKSETWPASRLGWPSCRSRSDTGWQPRKEKASCRDQQENDTQSNMTERRLCLYNSRRCSLMFTTRASQI